MTSSSSSNGIGFLGLLAVLFIGLKLTGHIAWPWWLVLSPLLPTAVLLVLVLVAGAVTVVKRAKE